jgi:hypothetical protein
LTFRWCGFTSKLSKKLVLTGEYDSLTVEKRALGGRRKLWEIAMRTARLLSALVLSAGLLGLTTVASQAVTFQFTSDHCTGTCGTPPFGTVDVIQVGANVVITSTLNAGFQYAQTGAADGQIFKFNGTGVVLTDIVVGAHVPALVAATGAFNGDGTGNFTFGINCPTCGNGPTGFGGAVSFTVLNAMIADLTGLNNLGNIFVADVLAPNGNTGPVDVTGVPAPVPLPPAAFLFGTALVGLGLLSRRRRNRDVSATA